MADVARPHVLRKGKAVRSPEMVGLHLGCESYFIVCRARMEEAKRNREEKTGKVLTGTLNSDQRLLIVSRNVSPSLDSVLPSERVCSLCG